MSTECCFPVFCLLFYASISVLPDNVLSLRGLARLSPVFLLPGLFGLPLFARYSYFKLTVLEVSGIMLAVCCISYFFVMIISRRRQENDKYHRP